MQPDAKPGGARSASGNILQHAVLESRDQPIFAHAAGDSDLCHVIRNTTIVSRSMKTLHICKTINQTLTLGES
jgi:hypothetical protein